MEALIVINEGNGVQIQPGQKFKTNPQRAEFLKGIAAAKQLRIVEQPVVVEVQEEDEVTPEDDETVKETVKTAEEVDETVDEVEEVEEVELTPAEIKAAAKAAAAAAKSK
jgi:uncharacterized protein (UPF0216 family)